MFYFMFFGGLSKYNGELYPDKLTGHSVKIIKSDTRINVKKFTERTESRKQYDDDVVKMTSSLRCFLIKFPANFDILLK